MALIEHRRHPIKAKPVEFVLIKIPANIRQEKPLDLPSIVVENLAPPELVVPLFALVEVLEACAVELVEAIVAVLRCVALRLVV